MGDVLRAGRMVVLAVVVAAFATACANTAEPPGEPVSADAVLQHLDDSGLPIGPSRAYDAATDPNGLLGTARQYTGKVTFQDRRLRVDEFTVKAGGTIEVFRSASDARERQRYLDTYNAGISLGEEYSFLEGTVLLRLSRELTPERAAEYRAALETFFEEQ